MDAPAVERELEIDLSAEELWELISTAEGWRSWLVDETALEVREGAAGTVVDDGERRSVVIERIADGEVSFVWRAEDGDVSRVVIAIDDTQPRVRLRITEQWLAPVACAECPLRAEARWDLRTCLLCLGALAPCRA